MHGRRIVVWAMEKQGSLLDQCDRSYRWMDRHGSWAAGYAAAVAVIVADPLIGFPGIRPLHTTNEESKRRRKTFPGGNRSDFGIR